MKVKKGSNLPVTGHEYSSFSEGDLKAGPLYIYSFYDGIATVIVACSATCYFLGQLSAESGSFNV